MELQVKWSRKWMITKQRNEDEAEGHMYISMRSLLV